MVGAGDDATTENLRRPPIRTISDDPNYAGRRAGVALALLAIVAGGAALVASIAGGGDDTADGSSAAPVLDRPVVTEVDSALAQAAPPTHHGYRDDVLYVALYGSIGSGRLGVLGESDVAGSIERAAEVAAEYERFGPQVIPTFEIIASIASFEAGEDYDYSNETPIAQLRPWIEAADAAGYHVVLDLQPGRQRFPSQVTEFEELILEPHVSVALDPEWRVGMDEVPEGGKVGTVSAAEVNKTVDFLDRLVELNDLPPKMLIVHQFQNRMITDKTDIRGTKNVQIVIHMDGFGPLTLKRDTYAQVTSDLPPGAVVGWKNFYDEDEPTPTPAETMANDPVPMFVSFQ